MDTEAFADLMAANERYANSAPRGFDGIARAGVLMVTCMDSRLQPLEMVGLMLGEAKILRTPGGFVHDDVVAGCVMGVHLLGVNRILVVGHTRCAAAAQDQAGLRRLVLERSGVDAEDFDFCSETDQVGRMKADCDRLREHPLLAGRATVGGFMYDVDTGSLTQLC